MIRSTFIPFTSPTNPLPKPIIPNLLKRFSSAQGYKLQPHVLELFQQLRETRSFTNDSLRVGVITNSDERVPSILSDLGLRVGNGRYGLSNQVSDRSEDINFVAMSYDIGFEKPDPRIFDAARKLGSIGNKTLEPYECMHVGDDVYKDLYAARAVGWRGYVVTPYGKEESKGSEMKNLSFLMDILNSYE